MAKDTRGRPRLYRDHHGELFIIVDDGGEPVSEYTESLATARELRDSAEDDGGRSWSGYRIASVGFKVLVPDDGSPWRSPTIRARPSRRFGRWARTGRARTSRRTRQRT